MKKINNLIEKQVFIKGLKNGKWETFFLDGKLSEEVFYNNGLRSGMFRSYHSNGVLNIETYYKDDELDGPWREYYESGQIQEIGKYENGKYFTIDFWSESGKQLLINGTGFKIEKFGASESDIYVHYFKDMKFVNEVKIAELEINELIR